MLMWNATKRDNCEVFKYQGSMFPVVRQPESAENSTGLPLYTDRLTEGLQANKMHKYVHILIYCSFILQNNG